MHHNTLFTQQTPHKLYLHHFYTTNTTTHVIYTTNTPQHTLLTQTHHTLYIHNTLDLHNKHTTLLIYTTHFIYTTNTPHSLFTQHTLFTQQTHHKLYLHTTQTLINVSLIYTLLHQSMMMVMLSPRKRVDLCVYMFLCLLSITKNVCVPSGTALH